eukprot:Phypoly_transcript_12306.p1 GENE.Phypoly_transcript_12306~~Phypoly_transcript_12306.p1  ORF type:complete len:319 (+),score=20.96 Phypoly_transcript_12306:65-958(+)
MGPLSLFSTIVCGIATITSYIYAQQRKFPNVVLVWTCLNDFFSCLYVTMNWIPGPVKDNVTLKVVEPRLCTLFLYSGSAMELSASMLSLLLAHTMYATIVKRIDLHEMRQAYYYKYLIIFWIPTVAIPLVCLTEVSHIPTNGYCLPSTKTVTGVKLITWFVPFVIQVVFMVPVFNAVFSISQAVRPSIAGRPSNKAILWLCARFVGAQCNQILVWFPATVWQLYSIFDKEIPYAVSVTIAFSFGFPALNGFIVIAGNAPLWNSIFGFFTSIHSWYTKSSFRICNKKYSNSSNQSKCK